jgi:glutaconate CoA-transferase subunit A
MEVLKEGKGELLGWHDPDDARDWVLNNKSRELKDKTMSVKEAVSKFIHDGDFIASGGFGHVRVSMAIVYEIGRQRKHNLAMADRTAVHDFDILVGSGSIDEVQENNQFEIILLDTIETSTEIADKDLKILCLETRPAGIVLGK